MPKQTVSHRLQAANLAWQRLRKILCAPRQLELSQRLTLWKATILPTLMYGLAAVEPAAKDVQRMQAMIVKHLRTMTHSFAHMQHESTKHLHERCNIPTATTQLLKESTAFLGRLRLLAVEVPFITSEQLESTRMYAANLQVATESQWTQPEPTGCSEAAYHCSACSRAFDSFRLLRSHEAKWHGRKTPSATGEVFDRNLRGLHGLPTCRHCGTRFRQWDSLVKHIQRQRCQKLRCPTSQPAPSHEKVLPSSTPAEAGESTVQILVETGSVDTPSIARTEPPPSPTQCMLTTSNPPVTSSRPSVETLPTLSRPTSLLRRPRHRILRQWNRHHWSSPLPSHRTCPSYSGLGYKSSCSKDNGRQYSGIPKSRPTSCIDARSASNGEPPLLLSSAT